MVALVHIRTRFRRKSFGTLHPNVAPRQFFSRGLELIVCKKKLKINLINAEDRGPLKNKMQTCHTEATKLMFAEKKFWEHLGNRGLSAQKS